MATDMERVVLLDNARKTCQHAYAEDPLDHENLTKWGAVLLELAPSLKHDQSVMMIREAESKLVEALQINPKRHETIWFLGNAYFTLGLYSEDDDIAEAYFAKASNTYQEAIKEDPDNDQYQKSLAMAISGSEIRLRLVKQMTSESAVSGGGSSSSAKASQKDRRMDLTYDVLGWVILAAGLVAWLVGTGKSNVHPPSSLPP